MNGFLLDDRNIPALGRIGDVDDILGSVLVRDGVVCDTLLSYFLVPHDIKSCR